MAIYDVLDLEVYKRALMALKLIYQLVEQLPKECFSLKQQIISSAQSIPPLIAEGFAKKFSTKEFKHFLRMAMGSSDEIITHLREIWLLAKKYEKIDLNTVKRAFKEYKIISKQLNSLIKNWIDYTKIINKK